MQIKIYLLLYGPHAPLVRGEGEEKGRNEGRAEGRAEGRVEGRVEEKIAIARNLKSMGMSISDVSKATGLQEEEIKALWIYCNSIGFIGTPKRNN